jgi:hypothetical protein
MCSEPGVFGPVALDPTVSRTIDALAADEPLALAAIKCGTPAHSCTVQPEAEATVGPWARAVIDLAGSRLGESNPGPTHYEGAAQRLQEL